MWTEVEWDKLDMDISDVSSEMIIGPKNIVMRKINDFNRHALHASRIRWQGGQVPAFDVKSESSFKILAPG